MNTAMQELMEWMVKTEFMVNKGFIEKINECLKKEKEQLKDAYLQWRPFEEDLNSSEEDLNSSEEEDFQEYYNDKYLKE